MSKLSTSSVMHVGPLSAGSGHRRTGTRLVAAALATSLVISGCATTSGGLESKYIVAGDACTPQRQQVIAGNQDFTGEIIQGAAVGALVGGLAAGLAGGSTRGILIGAAAGALAGGALNYFRARSERAQGNRNQLLTDIGSDAARDREKFGQFAGAVQALRNCREDQVVAIAEQARAGRIARPDATQRIESQRALHMQDTALIREVFGAVDSRGEIYVDATAAALDTQDKNRVLGSVATYNPTFVAARGQTFTIRGQSNVNVRSAARTNASILGTLAPGETIIATQTSEQWIQFDYRGRTGFVARSALNQQPASTRTTYVASTPRPAVENEQQAFIRDTREVAARDTAQDRQIGQLIDQTQSSLRVGT